MELAIHTAPSSNNMTTTKDILEKNEDEFHR
jgi:hypothetical protein